MVNYTLLGAFLDFEIDAQGPAIDHVCNHFEMIIGDSDSRVPIVIVCSSCMNPNDFKKYIECSYHIIIYTREKWIL